MITLRSIFVAILVGCAGTPSPSPPQDLDPILFLIDLGVVRPHSCGGSCTISSTCQDGLSSCGYCYLGQCAKILPASIPDDAGVDAPVKGNAP